MVTLRLGPRSLRSRGQTQKSLTFKKAEGGAGEAARKLKGIFGLLSPLRPTKSSVTVSILFERLPLRFSPSLWRPEALPYTEYVVTRYTLTLRKHLALAAHIRSRCLLGVACVRLVASFEFVVLKGSLFARTNP